MSEKPMLVTIQAASVLALDLLLEQAESGNKHLVIERDGQRVVAMIPIADYDALMKEREEVARNRALRLKRFDSG
jgi:PHD/YefM family antitoxin component YafN of YafNO toxin-antitoxin module